MQFGRNCTDSWLCGRFLWPHSLKRRRCYAIGLLDVWVPMFLFEMSSLGARFAVTRWLVNFAGIIAMALIIDKLIYHGKVL